MMVEVHGVCLKVFIIVKVILPDIGVHITPSEALDIVLTQPGASALKIIFVHVCVSLIDSQEIQTTRHRSSGRFKIFMLFQ
jgi:hypothetical protein